MKKFYYILLLLLPVLVMIGCSDENLYDGDSESATATLSYRVSLDDELDSRAIGDGEKVNQLKVGVFQDGAHIKTETIDNRVDGKFPVELTLLKNLEYTIVFWAQAKDNGIYTLDEETFEVDIDYSKYADISLVGTEAFEAFCAKDKVILGNKKTLTTDIKLTRPFAQFNIAAQEEGVFNKVESASLTIENVYTGINLLTGQPVGNATGKSLSFKYSDEDATTKQSIKIGEEDYYYVASAYLFSPEKVKLTGELYDGNNSVVKSFEFPEVTLKPNYRTNIYGEMIQVEELAPWDGITTTQPEFVDNKYVIDNASDLAWLSENGATLAANSTFLQIVDIDMAGKSIEPIKMPAGSTYDGGEKRIVNYANSLYGDATKVSVKNLTIENAVVPETGVTHVGVLMNTLSGSATFENVTVINSTANTTNGAAGGFVGYIKNDDTEELSVNFTKCTATDNNVSGSLTSGVYVGRFRGYKNTETLTFSADCNESTATFGSNAKASYYITDNAACWFTSEQIAVFSKYNGWLGCEEYYRGTVNYGDKRYIPKWDGTTKVTPLTEGTTKLIYSPFDLANCAGTEPGSIKFMTDVDMGTETFEPLTKISKLYGEGKTIYNLKVETKYDTQTANGGGFIRRCTTSTIENITFNNADVKVTHVEGSEGDALASIVCGTAEGNNTMTNVKVVGGKLYGCNKMGGIAGYITGTFNATNCSVDGLSIENYDSGGKDSFGFKAKGEVGGAFGFINAHATISDCYVKNTTLNCEGVNNGTIWLIITTKKYAGRHVNEFIGDIRTVSGQTITITYNEANFEGNKYMNREDHYSECKYIGHCYYTNVTVLGQGIKDTKGKVTVNGNSITVVENY